MGKITSADCVKFIEEKHDQKEILANVFTNWEWKRVSKHKEGDKIVRKFYNKKSKVYVTVHEHGEVLSIGEVVLIIPTLSELKENKIKVDLAVKPNKSKELTGGVVYALSEGGLGGCDDEFGFDCGPETEGGYLDDSDDGKCYKKLEELFSDIPGNNIEIGAAENSHIVKLIPGISAKDLWDVIVDRLERSGARKMEDE